MLLQADYFFNNGKMIDASKREWYTARGAFR